MSHGEGSVDGMVSNVMSPPRATRQLRYHFFYCKNGIKAEVKALRKEKKSVKISMHFGEEITFL